jgi:hypothetical protein
VPSLMLVVVVLLLVLLLLLLLVVVVAVGIVLTDSDNGPSHLATNMSRIRVTASHQ